MAELGERPCGARLGEYAPAVRSAKGRRSVVTHRTGQVQLLIEIECRLTEIRLVVNLSLVVARRIARQRIEDAEWLRGDQCPANHRKCSEVSRIQILAGGDGSAKVLTQVPGRRTGEVMIDRIIDHLAFGNAAAGGNVGALGRTPFEA